MSKQINTNIYSNRFKDLCTYMGYAWYSMRGVAGMLTSTGSSRLTTEVNGEIIFNYTGWNYRITSCYDNAKILQKFAYEMKAWLATYLNKDAYDGSLDEAIHDDIYTKSKHLNKKSNSCSPYMKNDWNRVKGILPDIEGECPTTGEILLWFDFLCGHDIKTLMKTYGQKMVDELIGMSANPFIIEFEKSYRDSVKAKQDELSNIEVEINEKWRALRKELEENWNKEREAARLAVNDELKKLKEEHDAQLMMLKLVK